MTTATHNILDALGGHGPGTAVDPVRYATLAYGLTFHNQQESWDGPVFEAFIRGMDQYWQWSEAPHRSAEPPDWCASFVSHCIRVGMGLPDWRDLDLGKFAPSVQGHPFRRWFVGVSQVVNWADDKGAWVEKPQPADIFVEYWEGKARHVGFVLEAHVVKPSAPAQAFSTLEGNYRDKVTSRVTMPHASLNYRFVDWRNA